MGTLEIKELKARLKKLLKEEKIIKIKNRIKKRKTKIELKKRKKKPTYYIIDEAWSVLKNPFAFNEK